jgi:hypothetical protein
MPNARRTPVDRNVHVKPDADGWSVFRGNAVSPVTTHRTVVDAIDFGRVLARATGTTLVIHEADGTIKYSERYDPLGEQLRPPPQA